MLIFSKGKIATEWCHYNSRKGTFWWQIQFFLQTNYSLIKTLYLLTTNSIKLQTDVWKTHAFINLSCVRFVLPVFKPWGGGGKHRDKMLYFLVSLAQLGPPHHVLFSLFSLSLIFEDLGLFTPTRLRLLLSFVPGGLVKQLLGESFSPCPTITTFTPTVLCCETSLHNTFCNIAIGKITRRRWKNTLVAFLLFRHLHFMLSHSCHTESASSTSGSLFQ